jgi:hypothetical protein
MAMHGAMNKDLDRMTSTSATTAQMLMKALSNLNVGTYPWSTWVVSMQIGETPMCCVLTRYDGVSYA